VTGPEGRTLPEPIRVLLVDDDPDDQLLTRDLIDEIETGQYRLDVASTYEEGRNALARREHDVVLLDYYLGGRTGLELLEEGPGLGCTAPLILLTGLGDRAVDDAAIQAGAADYLVKGQITPVLLERAMRHALERSRTLQALRESEERFRLLVQSVQDYAILVLSPEGRISTWNTGAERLTGYSVDEILGRSFDRLYVEQDRQRHWPEHLLRVAADQDRAEDEGWRVRKNGSRFWASAIITALRDEHGRLRGFANVIRDMTEQKRAEEERAKLIREQAARAEAEATVRARDEFLTVAAHELKTPLTSVVGAVQLAQHHLARGGEVNLERLARNLALAERQAVKLGRLINTLLDVSRSQAGRLQLHYLQVDLVPLVAGVVEAAGAQGTDHTFTLDAPASLRARVDPLRIEQVITNLVDNAIKYSPDGGRIEVELGAIDGDTVCLTVRDQGVGIPADRRERIFDQFYRAHGESYLSGLGVGLFVSRQIVELHGGSITAESPPGGTRLVVRLPVAGPPNGVAHAGARSGQQLERAPDR
jgi:PAS domain S-box-containing protein